MSKNIISGESFRWSKLHLMFVYNYISAGQMTAYSTYILYYITIETYVLFTIIECMVQRAPSKHISTTTVAAIRTKWKKDHVDKHRVPSNNYRRHYSKTAKIKLCSIKRR